MTRTLVCIALCILVPLCGCEVEQPLRAAPPASAQENLAEENARLKRELEETKHKLELQGRYTADATKTLNELQNHLSAISALEGEIRGGAEGGQPLTKSRRERMIAAVQRMESELEQQRKLIALFRNRESQYTERVAELGEAITQFERVIVSKNQEIARLRVEIQRAAVQIDTLTKDRIAAEAALEKSEGDLEKERERADSAERENRKAHYIVGSLKALRRRGIIVDKRVLLSRVWVVSPNLDTRQMREVDKDTMLPLGIVAPMDRIQIISPHPQESYTLAPQSPTQTLLTITDRERFWTTEYLVIGIR